jgi:hypothetical protein
MRQAKKTSIYKLSLFLLGLTVLINFSFCLMPSAASAHPSDLLSESNSHDKNKPDQKESCEVATVNDISKRSNLQKTTQNSATKNSNAILPCCCDLKKITKIDNVSNFKINDSQFYAILNDTDLDHKSESQNSSYIHSLNLPPPRTDMLFSVIKKE